MPKSPKIRNLFGVARLRCFLFVSFCEGRRKGEKKIAPTDERMTVQRAVRLLRRRTTGRPELTASLRARRPVSAMTGRARRMR